MREARGAGAELNLGFFFVVVSLVLAGASSASAQAPVDAPPTDDAPVAPPSDPGADADQAQDVAPVDIEATDPVPDATTPEAAAEASEAAIESEPLAPPTEEELAAEPELAREALGFAEMSIEELLEMTIRSGSLLELDPRSSPMSMTIITREQLRVSGERHLSEVLEIYVPGFQYMVNKWNGTLWGFRGTAPDRNTKFIVLVNGYRVNLESTHGYYTEIELGLMGDVERIEVLHGPAALALGPGSIAGAINIVTREAPGTRAEVRVGAGTIRDYRVEGYANLQLRDEESLSLAVGYRQAQGHGLRSGRIYGNNEWPTDGVPNPNGVPTDGSPWQAPGNMLASLDYRNGRFRIYGRYTSQQTPTGQYYIVDPYPEFGDPVPADAGPRVVDGMVVNPGDPLSMTESYGTNRRLHQVDAVHVHATYDVPVGDDTLSFELAVAGVTDRMTIQERAGYDVPGGSPRSGSVIWSFGERRYTAGARYLMQRVEDLQVAIGMQYRMDQIGNDMTGRNYFGGAEKHFFIDNVNYHSFAIFSEAMYDATPWLAVEAGIRSDYHTRGGWMVNPRASVAVTPNDDHVVRMLVQTSSNTGQADFYELNQANVDDDGNPRVGAYLENPLDPTSNIVQRANIDELRSLDPERAVSAELNGTHTLLDVLTLRHSASYTKISNLFAWNTDLFRTVNAGSYSFFTLELAAYLDLPGSLRAGLNHTYTNVLDANLDPAIFMRPGTTVVDNGDGTYGVVEDPSNPQTIAVSAVRDQITTDGRNFLNLSSNMTKVQLTWSPISWLTVHTNMRLFWGLQGRRQLWADDIAAGDNYLGLQRGSAVMVKWNASVHFQLASRTSLAIFAYDILGTSRNRHSVRWQQTANPVQRELYTVDQRMFSAQLQQEF